MNLNKLNFVAIIGGGNVGTQFACALASKGYTVNIFTSKPQLFKKTLTIIDENDVSISGEINISSDDIAEVLKSADIVFITYPAFMFEDLSIMIAPYVREGMILCVLPGTGGAEFAFKKCIERGAVLTGLQRVPSVSRLVKYGEVVRCEGLRDELFIASIPNGQSLKVKDLLEELWGIPCTILPNYLNVTLTPSNPILHTTRLRTLFSDYHEGRVYKCNPLFYGEWDDASSDLLLKCDLELQEMIQILKGIDLSFVRSLRIHYESKTISEMTKKLSSIPSLHNLSSPMVETEEGWIPDFKSRYFTADFPYGLAIIEELSVILDYDAVNIRETMDWYRRVSNDRNRFELSQYGIYSKEDIYNYYK